MLLFKTIFSSKKNKDNCYSYSQNNECLLWYISVVKIKKIEEKKNKNKQNKQKHKHIFLIAPHLKLVEVSLESFVILVFKLSEN